MAKACDICGSRKWRKDKVTGNAICEEGHVQQNYRSEVLDMEIGGPRHQLQRRKMGNRGPRRNKRREEGRANPLFYHGAEAEYLRIQALQILLRLQIQAISKLWSLPETYEMIVRDLWTYQLSISCLPSWPTSTDGRQTPESDIVAITKQSQPSQPDVEMADEERKSDDDSSTDPEHEKDDLSENEEGDGRASDVDSEILEEIEGMSKEEDLEDEAMIEKQNQDRRGKKKLRISDTIITLVMGLWIMRIPFIGIDIESAINEMKIPYIDFYHTTHLPTEIKRHMNRDVMIALAPLRSPSPTMIHRQCKVFARRLNKKYGIEVPETNAQPVVWRITSSLGGTPTTYLQITRLLTILDVNLSLIEREISTFHRKAKSRTHMQRDTERDGDDSPDLISSNGEGLESYERTLLYQDVIAPEVVIVSAWIVIMKITYGLDGIPREALLRSDPAVGLPNANVWMTELRTRLNEGVLRGSRKDREKPHFHTMDPDDMDAFLFKAERILLSHREEPSDVSMFPLTPHAPHEESVVPANSWANFHSNTATQTSNQIRHNPIKPNEGINKSLPLMPGEKIQSFPSNDPFLELPTELEVVSNAAAELIGWDAVEVSRVVEALERRLEKIRPRDERGRKKFDEATSETDNDKIEAEAEAQAGGQVEVRRDRESPV
ncbi:uncharacterized protein I303_103501 [Kwoniella dejecticola CBS 10117]|uniref:RRN7-type domain-containing protein n=1 Tax=Kwoniella dejecticola CBS 10117 TaxID=1296121 RepID=A0AAJ8KNR6_9TREE